ncbi:YCF48-related protein [Paenibacillus sp. CN-4]|uniref:VPS10 domain-containing protein n=1 Tax=Paenibacillus nanchangensis TaxID=3348343 RepID=UPI003979622E
MPRATNHRAVRPWLLVPLVLILFLTACTSSPAPEPSPVPKPTASPEEGQTITLITPDAANIDAENNAKYQIQTRLTDFQLLSETEGLAWGVTKNSLRIYLTRDNGQTWTNISPSPTIQFASNPVYGKDIFFTDVKHGWMIREASGVTETVVLRTRDGGQTWNVSSLPATASVSSIYFDTSKRGWLMSVWDGTALRENKTLFRTQDGGATWSPVMQNQDIKPGVRQTFIPVQGLTKGLAFRNARSGFAVVQDDRLPKLYSTSDGGAEWTEGPGLPPLILPGGCDRVAAGMPDFFAGTTASGWIPLACEQGETTAYHGIFTADGGESWKLASFSLGAGSGVNRAVPPTFLNASMGWALKNDLLLHTVDQGRTWTPLPPSKILQDKLAEYPEIVKLQFFSKEVGWLLIQKSDKRRSLLLQTTNGGVNWHVL